MTVPESNKSADSLPAKPNESASNLLSALTSMDSGQTTQNIFPALITMDRQDLQENMSSAPGPIRRRNKIASARFQPARIKRIMQSDDEIGRMKDGVPAAIGKAMEHFAEKFLRASANEAKTNNSKTLGPKDMKAAMLNDPSFSFLEKVLGEIACPPKKKKYEQPAKTTNKEKTLSPETSAYNGSQ